MDDPSIIGRFKVIALIDQSILGDVYHAADTNNGNEVYLRAYSAACFQDPASRIHFQNETQLIDYLSMPAISAVTEFWEDKGILYSVSPYYGEGSLKDRLKKGPLTPKEVVNILQQLAPCLEKLHEAEIVHGNITPGNLLYDRQGNIRLASFGSYHLARAAAADKKDLLVGAPGYSSPEQIVGHAVSPASDLYMLGAVIYEALTGQQPFFAESALAIAVQHLTAPPQPVTDLRSEIPAWFNGFFEKALHKEPEHRFTSAQEMLAVLERGADVVAPEREAEGVSISAALVESTRPPHPASAAPLPHVSSTSIDQTSGRPPSTRQKNRKWRMLSFAGIPILGIALLAAVFLITQPFLPGTLQDLFNSFVYKSPVPVSIAPPTPLNTSPEAAAPGAVEFAEAAVATPTSALPTAAPAKPTVTPTPRANRTNTPKPTATPAQAVTPTLQPFVVETSLAVIRLGEDPAPVPPNHTVQYNDSLFPIAIQYGVDLNELIGLNSLSCQSSLTVGSRLVLPARRAVVNHPTGVEIHESTIRNFNLVHVMDCIKDIRAVAISPDGKILAGASGNLIFLWEIDTWVPLARLRGHQSSVNTLKFSPNGEFLASGSEDATVRIWNVNDASNVVTLKGHTGSITGIAYSPGGQTIVSTARDSSARVWKTDGTMVSKFSGYDTYSAAFSPDERFLALGYADSVRIFDTAEFKLQTRLNSLNVVSRLAFSPDGKLIASNSEIWHVEEARQLFSFDKVNEDVTFSSDGQLLLIGRKAWKVSNGTLIATIKPPLTESLRTANEWDSFAWSLEKGMMAWGNKDWLVVLRTIDTGRINTSSGIHTVGSGENLMTISIQHRVPLSDLMKENQFKCDSPIFDSQQVRIPQASSILAGSAQYPSLGPENFNRLASILTPAMSCVKDIGKVFFSGDGKSFLSGSGVWDLSTGLLVVQPELVPIGTDGTFNTQRPAQLMVFSPTDSIVAIRSGKVIEIRNTLNGRLEKTLEGHKGNVSTLAFSPDGTLLASGSDSGEQAIYIWDVKSGTHQQTISGFSVQRMMFTPDNQYLLSQGEETVRYWRLADGRMTLSLQGIEGEAAFSPDGSLIAYASCIEKSGNKCKLKAVAVYRVASGTFAPPLTGITEDTGTVRFTPDGSKIIASSGYGLRIWDAASGTLLHNIATAGDVTPIQQFFLSIDGEFIFSVLGNRTLQVWSTESGQLIYTRSSVSITDMAFHRDKNMVAVLLGNRVEIWAVK